MKQIGVAGLAVIASPFAEKQLLAMMPVSFASKPLGRWTVKVGAAIGTAYAAKALLGREAARLTYIVLGANLVADAVAEFMPAIGVGYYTQPQLSGFNGMGLVTSGMSASGPYVGISGPPRPVIAGQDPFTPLY